MNQYQTRKPFRETKAILERHLGDTFEVYNPRLPRYAPECEELLIRHKRTGEVAFVIRNPQGEMDLELSDKAWDIFIPWVERAFGIEADFELLVKCQELGIKIPGTLPETG